MNSNEAFWFLNALFDQAASAGSLIALWTLQDRKSYFHAGCASAAEQATKLAKAKDVYFGLGLRRPGLASHQRGCAEDVRAITCLWLDVDWAGPGHLDTAKTLPPDEAGAGKVIELLHPAPSLIVRSGGGYHAYWLFSEPYEIGSDQDRREIAQLAERWGVGIQQEVKARMGWDLDSTHDLARVLRVPGTINHKGGGSIPVTLLPRWGDSEPVRYDFTTLTERAEELCPDLVVAAKATATAGAGEFNGVMINANANPPAEQFAALLENDPRFARTWARQRRDLKDQSDSSYDLALACGAMLAEWQPQDVVDLLVAFRRTSSNPAKGLRRDYISQTLSKARRATQEVKAEVDTDRKLEAAQAVAERVQRASSVVAQSVNNGRSNAPSLEGNSIPPDLIAALREVLTIPIARWLQVGTEDAEYVIVLADERLVPVGPVDAWSRNADRFRDRVIEAIQHPIPRFTAKKWTKIVALLCRITEVVDNLECTRHGKLARWITSYRSKRQVYEYADRRSALGENLPYMHENRLHVNAPDLRRYIHRYLDEMITLKNLCLMLHTVGGVRVQASVRDESGDVLTRAYWRLPASLTCEPEKEEKKGTKDDG